MQRVTVIYFNKPAARFDLEYYLKHHIPMVCRHLGSHLIRCDVAESLSGPTAVPIRVTASIYLDSHHVFKDMMQNHGAEILGDVTNYTDIEPTIVYENIHTVSLTHS